jgi:nucleoside-diphosphate-sugar epimerase
MRVFIIGGTQLSGPYLVRHLLQMGHEVTVYHRGNHPENVPPVVQQIIAPRGPADPVDRYHLRGLKDPLRELRPEVVVHMIAFTAADAEVFVEVFRGIARRAVVAGSSDVYRVMGILNRTESGPPVPVPIDENGPLREKPSIHGSNSEKKDVERVVMAEPKLPATVLRYPAIYGPGTYRLQEWIRPMLDNRPAILIGGGYARFRFTHSFAEDIGYATALAATDDRAAGRIYNVGERDKPTQRQRLEHFARVFGYRGRIVEAADEILPGGDGLPFPNQDWLLDTIRIRNELGFAEVANYDQAIAATIRWHKEHPNPNFKPDYAAEDAFLLKQGV